MTRPLHLTWAVLATGVAVAAIVPTSHAYTGGPITAQVLGYDRAERKVFFRLDNHDESGEPTRVGYFALSSADPSRPRWVRFKPRAKEPAASIAVVDNITRLAGRLSRLVPATQYDLQVHVRTVRADTLRSRFMQTPRCSLEVHLQSDSLSAITSVITFGTPRVGVWAFFAIPGESAAVAILSADAKRYEEAGEDLQTPVLLLPRERRP